MIPAELQMRINIRLCAALWGLWRLLYIPLFICDVICSIKPALLYFCQKGPEAICFRLFINLSVHVSVACSVMCLLLKYLLLQCVISLKISHTPRSQVKVTFSSLMGHSFVDSGAITWTECTSMCFRQLYRLNWSVQDFQKFEAQR